MRALLDTHVLLWWRCDDPRLSPDVRALFEDPGSELLWSAVSTAEIAVKSSIGKLSLPDPADAWTRRALREDCLTPLALTGEHAARLEGLPLHHRDPFDRLLIAQCQSEEVPLVTADRSLAAYDVAIIR